MKMMAMSARAEAKTAAMGVSRLASNSPSTDGSVRSRDIVRAMREAASKLACSADRVERIAATTTSQ